METDTNFEVELDQKHFPDLMERKGGHGILIIEDDSSDMHLLQITIQENIPDIDIYKASSINEAYRRYRNKDLSLIILDLNLPDTIGPRSVLEIKKINATAPIIVTTGFLTDLTSKTCHELGAVYSISKSNIRSDEFTKKLYDLIGVKPA